MIDAANSAGAGGSLQIDDFVALMTDGELDASGDDAQSKADFLKLTEEAKEFDMAKKAAAREVQAAEQKALLSSLVQAWRIDVNTIEFKKMLRANPVTEWYLGLAAKAKVVEESAWFNVLMTVVIGLAGALVGAQTELEKPGKPFSSPIADALDNFILAMFTVEIVVKFVAFGITPLKYFNDAWNKFDFFIVGACYIFMLPFMPNLRSLLAMLRLLRLLRVLKLVKKLPQLRVIIEALIAGFGSITFVVIILFIFYYIYAQIGMILFGRNDPAHYATLQSALITTFRLATLDGWSDILYVLFQGKTRDGVAEIELITFSCHATCPPKVIPKRPLFMIYFTGTLMCTDVTTGYTRKVVHSRTLRQISFHG